MTDDITEKVARAIIDTDGFPDRLLEMADAALSASGYREREDVIQSLRARAADVETLTDVLRALVEAVREQDDAIDPTSSLMQAVRDAESWTQGKGTSGYREMREENERLRDALKICRRAFSALQDVPIGSAAGIVLEAEIKALAALSKDSP